MVSDLRRIERKPAPTHASVSASGTLRGYVFKLIGRRDDPAAGRPANRESLLAMRGCPEPPEVLRCAGEGSPPPRMGRRDASASRRPRGAGDAQWVLPLCPSGSSR